MRHLRGSELCQTIDGSEDSYRLPPPTWEAWETQNPRGQRTHVRSGRGSPWAPPRRGRGRGRGCGEAARARLRERGAEAAETAAAAAESVAVPGIVVAA